MYGYSYFPNPATAGADQLGTYLISGLVVFGLVFLFNAYWMKRFQKGGSRTKRPKTPREKAVLVMCGAFVGLLLIMILGIYLG